MATRPMAVQLPPEVRTELEQKLLQNGFANYESLHTWLQDRGYSFGLSTIKRFGKAFEQRCEMVRLSTQQAAEMKRHFGDDDAAMGEAALQMAQTLIFQLMLERGEELEPKEIGTITRALADATRGTIQVKRYQEEVKTKAVAAAASVTDAARRGGLSEDVIRQIEQEVLGIA